MQQLPYILLIVGGILMIFSLFMPDKEKKKQKEIRENLTTEERASLIAQGKKEIDQIFNDKAEDALEKADEELSRLSNEKIISVSEYSDQVLEKINQNHQEVVFLYNMLNEKEEEMKKMMAKMKTVSKEDTAGEKQMENLAKRAGEPVMFAAAPADPPVQIPVAENGYAQDNADMEMLRGLLYGDKEAADMSDAATGQGKESISSKVENYGGFAAVQQTPGRYEETAGTENSLQNQVLAMHEQGMSVLEISKALNKGQGEVRLIIDLYARKQS